MECSCDCVDWFQQLDGVAAANKKGGGLSEGSVAAPKGSCL